LFPKADLVVGLMQPCAREFNEVTRRARETWLARIPGAQKHHRWFVPFEPLAFATLDTSGYDLIISSSHAFAKAVRKPKHAVHICYCYSPPRYLWDLRNAHWSAATCAQRIALALGSGILRRVDRASARGVDHFVAISRFVAERIRRCYGKPATVVYPPVRAKGKYGELESRQDFALCLGRLVPYKRVDLAIEACRRANLKLVVAGDGPERHRLERLADGGVEFVGAISEAEAGRLLSTCRAFIFCAEDDFGIAPLEANAHGAPVVYLNRGGATETMDPFVTGVPFDAATPEHVTQGIQEVLARRWSEDALRKNAARFAPEAFRAGLVAVVRQALE
jgi:glycosyltransferase involved in cell wall biosynthesis